MKNESCSEGYKRLYSKTWCFCVRTILNPTIFQKRSCDENFLNNAILILVTHYSSYRMVSSPSVLRNQTCTQQVRARSSTCLYDLVEKIYLPKVLQCNWSLYYHHVGQVIHQSAYLYEADQTSKNFNYDVLHFQ